MKKSLLILCAAALALVSCNKDLTPNETKQGEPVDVVFNLSATHPDGGGTKAVKDAWETGDVVFVFFSEQTAPAYLELKYDGSKWENNQKGLSFTTGETGTMTAVYLPFGSDATVSADGGAYKFSETYLSFYLTAQLPYTVSGGEVSGTFSMQIPAGFVQFFLDDAAAAAGTRIELREPQLTPQGIASVAADGSVVTTAIAHGAPLPGYVYDKQNKSSGETKGWVFSGILASDVRGVDAEYYFTLVKGGWEGSYYHKEYTFGEKTFLTLYRGETSWRALKLPALTDWTAITDYKPIDLGCDVTVDEVTKRIYWSSRNLGATSDLPASTAESDIQATWGDYYAWGETDTYYEAGYAYESPGTHWKTGKTDGYADKSYKFNFNGIFSKLTKYCYNPEYGNEGYSDSLYTLEAEDDAARYVAKGIWRTPTRAEWNALNTEAYTNSYDTDLKGTKVTCNITGYDDGRYLFLPAAGYRQQLEHRQGANNDCGFYWTSSLYDDYPFYAFNAQVHGFSGVFNEMRQCGNSIRPVSD